jgi:ribonuclease HII
VIREQAVAIGIGVVSAEEIDRMGILAASLEAMRRAVDQVAERISVDHLLVDARTIPGVSTPQTPLVHGDAIDGSIAAASIVAKVYRDRLMREYDAVHAGYGFARHKGYGTAEHLEALGRIGASPIHRRSFAPVAAVLRG